MPKGPRGFQCPKCWEKNRKDALGRTPKLFTEDSKAPASMIQIRYRVCLVCGHNEVTEERLRSGSKTNKADHPKRLTRARRKYRLKYLHGNKPAHCHPKSS